MSTIISIASLTERSTVAVCTYLRPCQGASILKPNQGNDEGHVQRSVRGRFNLDFKLL